MIVVIDNYDSFTYNLVQYFGELGQDIRVFRNDAVTVDELARLEPDHIVVSPGPCTPKEAGVSNDVLRVLGGEVRIPTLGVCLGHQCMGYVFGGNVIRARRLMHGKTSAIYHDRQGLFEGLPSPFEAIRYHSLLVERSSLPDCLEITAETMWDDREIMGLRHREFPIEGVQFHPESIATEHGHDLLRNFLRMKRAGRGG